MFTLQRSLITEDYFPGDESDDSSDSEEIAQRFRSKVFNMMRRTAQGPPTSNPPLEHGGLPNPKKSPGIVSVPSTVVVSRSKVSTDLDSRPPASFSPPYISVRPVSGLISGFNHFPFQGRLARVDSQQLRHGAPLNITNGIQPLRQPRPVLHSDNRIQIIHQPFDNKSNHNFSAEFSRFHVSEINVTPADDSEHDDVESAIVHIKEEMPEEVSDDDDGADDSDSGDEKESTQTAIAEASEVSKQPLDDHSVLRGIEKPGSPEKKRRSAFVCESLDTYLEENKPAQPDKCDPFDFKKREEERATPTTSVCTNEDDMKSMVVGCFRYFMFESLRDMKGHVLSTAMSKMAKGKSFEKEPSRMRGFRRKFGTTETIAVRHAGDRHKWKSGRHHARDAVAERYRRAVSDLVSTL